jgi:predicted RNase H-like HicB family nuclease
MAQQLFIEVTLPFHMLVYPAPDVPGDFVAHCLELDMVAQGTSKDHAREVLKDALQTLIQFNLDKGLVPIQIRFAPREVWEAARVTRPESMDVKALFRFTPADRSIKPIDLAELPLLFETIEADRAPRASA